MWFQPSSQLYIVSHQKTSKSKHKLAVHPKVFSTDNKYIFRNDKVRLNKTNLSDRTLYTFQGREFWIQFYKQFFYYTPTNIPNIMTISSLSLSFSLWTHSDKTHIQKHLCIYFAHSSKAQNAERVLDMLILIYLLSSSLILSSTIDWVSLTALGMIWECLCVWLTHSNSRPDRVKLANSRW